MYTEHGSEVLSLSYLGNIVIKNDTEPWEERESFKPS